MITEKKNCSDVVEKDKKKFENLNTILNDKCNTADKKRLEYGIEIEKLSQPVRPYYIRQPTFSNGKNNKLTVKDISKIIPVARESMGTDEWICLYAQKEEKISYILLDGFIKCAKGYGINFKNNDSNWIPMESKNPNIWINTVDSELNSRKSCKFVIFLINKYMNDLYIPLKNHSFCQQGYISQVIKVESIIKAMKSKRGPDSYYSKILLQINNKIGGFNYFLNVDPYINDMKIMLIGIDTSHIWAKKNKELEERTGIAMIATKDKNFSKFYNKQEILIGDVHYASETARKIASFIKEAYAKYLKENKQQSPKNIIIYRQGIAYNQLKYVDIEVKSIKEICEELKLNYYYVNVNTRVTTKLFEYNSKKDLINLTEFIQIVIEKFYFSPV